MTLTTVAPASRPPGLTDTRQALLAYAGRAADETIAPDVLFYGVRGLLPHLPDDEQREGLFADLVTTVERLADLDAGTLDPLMVIDYDMPLGGGVSTEAAARSVLLSERDAAVDAILAGWRPGGDR